MPMRTSRKATIAYKLIERSSLFLKGCVCEKKREFWFCLDEFYIM
jgi:hypothetical protein